MDKSSINDSTPHLAKPVLCDGFLIPLTDFVLQIDELLPCDLGQDFSSWNLSKLITIENYAKFLKQPLKLEMFVPCDEDGNLWEYPLTKEEWEWAQKDSADAEQSFKQKEYYYEKAKEKILFEGFEPYEDYECAKYEDVYVDEEVCDVKFTIEELIKDVGETKIKLSQTALNAIFGKTVA